MFSVGDRVKLIEDFNNEPGILPAGSKGTVYEVAEGRTLYNFMIFVCFDNVDALGDRARRTNDVAGLPMYPEEIESV
jgi:hypothetical protein